MIATGVAVAQVARLEQISEPTLRRYYADEIETAATRANTAVAQALYKAAVGGDWRAAATWLKCRANWVEATAAPCVVEYVGAKAQAEESARTAEVDTGWDGLLLGRVQCSTAAIFAPATESSSKPTRSS